MGKFLTLVRRETGAILLSSPILFATAFFVLIDSFAFYLYISGEPPILAVFDDMAMFMLFTSLLIFPVVSMHSFAEDNAKGTLETLLTAPIGSFTTVMAKFTGSMVFVVIYLLHGLVYATLLSYGGNLDWHVTFAAFLALCMVGALAMSLGVFISSVTISPAAAAAGTAGLLILMAVAGDIDPASGGVASIAYSTSFIPHAKRWIAGELDTRGLVYFASCIALFLFYAWLSLGSRGMERRASNPTVRRRMKATYLLVVAGFLCLLLQVAYLHIRGFWERATPLGPALARVSWPWLLPLALGLVAFGWSVLTYRAARRAEPGRQKKPDAAAMRYATITETRVMGAGRKYYLESLRRQRRQYFAAAAALVIVLNLNWLSHYPFRTFSDSPYLSFLTVFQERRWDVSAEGRNSLSPQTRRVLDTLQGRVRIYNFLPLSAEMREVPVGNEFRRLLDRYGDYNGLVAAANADPVREPDLAAELAEELDLPRNELGQIAVIEYRGRRLTLSASAFVRPPDWQAELAGDSRWVFDGESRLTQAILRVVDPRTPHVLFAMGRRELTPTAGGRPERSASRFARALVGGNMRVGSLVLADERGVPPDCDVLVVASPGLPYGKVETGVIRRYLDNGGRLLLLAPQAGEDYAAADDSLAELAFELGGTYRDDVLLDAKNNDNGLETSPVARSRGADADSPGLVFPLSRTIRDNPRSAETGWVSERMVESSPESVSRGLLGGPTRAGPFTLIYRAAKTLDDSREARAVVVASGRMASDSALAKRANEAYLTALTQWLAGRDTVTDIAPRIWIDRRMSLLGPQMRAILWIGVVALPLAWLLASISVWWLRRE